MSIIHIGELSSRLRLEAPVRSPDGAGGATVTWSLVAEVWGAIRPIGGAEALEADGLKGRTTHEIWIRHRDGVLPEMRFVLGSRVFDIRAVVATAERNRFMKCLADERIP
jgi:SPP1 family predicted phage head-tail adaptor